MTINMNYNKYFILWCLNKKLNYHTSNKILNYLIELYYSDYIKILNMNECKQLSLTLQYTNIILNILNNKQLLNFTIKNDSYFRQGYKDIIINKRRYFILLRNDYEDLALYILFSYYH